MRGRPSTTTSAAASSDVERRAVGVDAALAPRQVGVLVDRQAGIADLHDVGAVAGEEVGAEAGGEAAAELDHADAGERQVVGAHRSNVAVRMPRASVWPYIVKPTNAGIESTVAPVLLDVEGVDGEHVAVRPVAGWWSGTDVAEHVGVVARLHGAGRQVGAVR